MFEKQIYLNEQIPFGIGATKLETLFGTDAPIFQETRPNFGTELGQYISPLIYVPDIPLRRPALESLLTMKIV